MKMPVDLKDIRLDDTAYFRGGGKGVVSSLSPGEMICYLSFDGGEYPHFYHRPETGSVTERSEDVLDIIRIKKPTKAQHPQEGFHPVRALKRFLRISS